MCHKHGTREILAAQLPLAVPVARNWKNWASSTCQARLYSG
jgi:hypothetical protein